jgi:hypothetical protein
MAHAPNSVGHEHPGIAVVPTAVPLGVHCRGCRRLLLPAQLWPLAIRSRPDGHTEVELRCVRCNAVGSVILDPDDDHHRTLLSMWSAQHTGRGIDADNINTRTT